MQCQQPSAAISARKTSGTQGMVCIKNRQNSQEGGTTFARRVQILPRHRLTNQKRFLCFNQEQITERAWPRVPQSSSLCPSCAKEKTSGVENEWKTKKYAQKSGQRSTFSFLISLFFIISQNACLNFFEAAFELLLYRKYGKGFKPFR